MSAFTNRLPVKCLLSGVKRTCHFAPQMSANAPKADIASSKSRSAAGTYEQFPDIARELGPRTLQREVYSPNIIHFIFVRKD